MLGETFFERLLVRLKGNFIVAGVFLAQLMALPGAVLGWVSIQINADFSDAQLRQIFWITPVSIFIVNLALIGITWVLTQNARRRLIKVVENPGTVEDITESAPAWREVSSIAWRYGLIAAPLTFVAGILPGAAYFYFSRIANLDQFIYLNIGGFVAVIAMVIFTTVIIESVLFPARKLLLPKEIETQLKEIRGAPIGLKLGVIALGIVLIGILMVAPIGYHQIVRATINIFDPAQIVRNLQIRQTLQVQSLLVSAGTLTLSLVLIYAVSRSLTRPIRSMVDTFRTVEQGNLSIRADVAATDEIGMLAIHFNRMLTRLETLQTSLEEQVKERTDQLEAINEVGRAVSAILDPDELIEKVVNLITDRFGYYYSALFLIDASGRWAELHAATGEAGRVLKESKHRLEVGGKSMVGTAIQSRRARIALDVGAESVRFDNPLLPYTRSEIALPLAVGDRTLGALDVQSTKQSAFTQRDIETLQNMANQVAVAIENAHLFQETRARLEELQAAQRQYLQEAWTSIARQENTEYTLGELTEQESKLNVNLTLRDQIIGEISLAGDTSWSTEERAWIEAVATQAAIALENARLLDQSQKNAAYEKMIAEITSKIWSSSSIDGILQTSIRELGRALNAIEAVIELGTDENEA